MNFSENYYKETGALKSSGYTDLDGYKFGIWCYYDVEGNLISRMNYRGDKLNGVSYVIDKSNKKFYKGYFFNDMLVTKSEFKRKILAEKLKSFFYKFK